MKDQLYLKEYFNDQELQELEEHDIILDNKEYNYEEFSYIKNEYLRIAGNLENKFIEIEKQYTKFFDFSNWKYKTFTNAVELDEFVNKNSINNKRIIDIFQTGNDIMLCKTSMVDYYNNLTYEYRIEVPDWDLMKKITRDRIKDSYVRGTYFANNTPIVLLFDDNTSLEILIADELVFISFNELKDSNYIKNTYNVNLKSNCKDLLNKTVDDFVIRTNNNDYDNIHDIQIKLKENAILYIMDGGISYNELDEDGKIKGISFGDYLKNVYKSELLFSNIDELRFPKDENNPQKSKPLSELDKGMIEVFKYYNVHPDSVMAILMLYSKSEEAKLEFFKELRTHLKSDFNNQSIQLFAVNIYQKFEEETNKKEG